MTGSESGSWTRATLWMCVVKNLQFIIETFLHFQQWDLEPVQHPKPVQLKWWAQGAFDTTISCYCFLFVACLVCYVGACYRYQSSSCLIECGCLSNSRNPALRAWRMSAPHQLYRSIFCTAVLMITRQVAGQQVGVVVPSSSLHSLFDKVEGNSHARHLTRSSQLVVCRWSSHHRYSTVIIKTFFNQAIEASVVVLLLFSVCRCL